MNVTELDLSDNLLDLTNSNSVNRLNLLSHLVSLNLSGNYLPLLLRDHFYSLPSLKILDLSRCKLAAVEANALVKLSSLQMLLLGDIQSTAVKDLRLSQFVELRGEQNNRQQVGDRGMITRASKRMAQDDHNDGMNTLVLSVLDLVFLQLVTHTVGVKRINLLKNIVSVP